MKFRFLEDITTADVAFEAYGKNLDELFANAGLALEEVMVDTATVAPRLNSKFKISQRATDLKQENLLFEFLNELVFLKDRDLLLFSKIKVKIKASAAGRLFLAADLFGEPIDQNRHHLRVDVKAVTNHLFKITQENEGFKAVIILDI